MIKYALVPFIAYFFYWAVWFEIGVLQKPIEQAWNSAYPNWIFLIALVALEIFVLYREYKGKAQMQVKMEATKDDPFRRAKKREVDPDSVKHFMKGTFDGWDDRINRAFESVGGSTLPKRVFLKTKRLCYGFLFVLYVALALLSLGNPLYLVLFVFTAYAFLENLLWARHFQRVKRRKNNESK